MEGFFFCVCVGVCVGGVGVCVCVCVFRLFTAIMVKLILESYAAYLYLNMGIQC